MKILCVYPYIPESSNGVMRFVQSLYSSSPDEIEEIGVWFDLYYKCGDEVLEARTPLEKERLKHRVADKISTECDVIHLNTYAIDIDDLRSLEELKKAKPERKLVYTVHSLALQDFERNPYDRELFGIDNDFILDINKLSKVCYGENEEIKENRIRELLKKHGKPTNQECIERLKIRAYMIGLQQKIMAISDKNVFVSEFLRDCSKRLYGIDGVVIPNGTDMYKIYEDHKQKIETIAKKWRDKYHPGGDDILIGYVGRVTESKDIFELLEAFKKLAKEMGNVYLYFAGPYSDYIFEEIEERCGSLFGERVFFMDRETMPRKFTIEGQIHMAEVYRVFDLVVYPSYYEPFGLVPLEAVSCGTPVLVRNIDNLSYFVKEGICEGFGGEVGKRPELGFEHLELYQKMKEMVLNLDFYRRKTESAKEVVKEKYSVQSIREKYKKLFTNVVPITSSSSPTVVLTTVFSYDRIIPLLTLPLSNLISGYGCEPSKEVEIYGNKYRCCKLGAGGWGVVYLCERGGERIVVKMPFYAEAMFLGYERLTEYSGLIEQQHELEILKSLDHPNILKLLDVKGPFLFYEYADHGSLAWQLANGYKPSLDDIFLLTLQISDALRYVHSRGMVHGDVKPSNILLVEGIAKLGDFSSAKLIAGISLSKIPSTHGYRAPEQVYAEWKKRVEQLGLENRVDIYQLGSALLHVAMGEPLDGEEANEEEVGRRVGRVGDEKLATLLREMLSIDPARRPSAEEVVKKAYALLKKTA